eukprot:2281603-Amphidinium_carterae.2
MLALMPSLHDRRVVSANGDIPPRVHQDTVHRPCLSWPQGDLLAPRAGRRPKPPAWRVAAGNSPTRRYRRMDSVAAAHLCTGVAPPSGWRVAAPGAHGVAPIVQPRGRAIVERTPHPPL